MTIEAKPSTSAQDAPAHLRDGRDPIFWNLGPLLASSGNGDQGQWFLHGPVRPGRGSECVETASHYAEIQPPGDDFPDEPITTI